jgi:hypothetical protein
VLDSAAETPASVTSPDNGLEVLYRRTRPTPTPAKIPQWLVSIGSGDGEVQYTIEVSRMPTDVHPTITRILADNAQTLTVRGHPAVSSSDDGGFLGGLVWDEAPGIRVLLQGPADIDTLIRIAESLTLVPADDPRIKDRSEPGRR